MAELRYQADVDLSNANTSHTMIVELVGANRRVLDAGCATGYLGEALRARGCRVTGIEADEAAAEVARSRLDELVVADLERLDLVERFGPASFDAVVFGDVLEHLRDPLAPLRQARRLLVPGGSVVVSIPNVAHGDVRLSLLGGRFDYRPLGLLDATHLRFFTRRSVEELLAAAGLVAVEMRRTTAPLFSTELGVRPEDFAADVVRQVEEDPEATTYQFVVEALADDGAQAVRELHEREERSREEIARLALALRRHEADLARSRAEAARTAADLAARDSEIAAMRAAIAHYERRLAPLRWPPAYAALKAARRVRRRST